VIEIHLLFPEETPMSYADNPIQFTASEDDWLDRRPAVNALLRLLTGSKLLTPIAVGVYGGWGTGKTSVMQTLKAELSHSGDLMLWFEAWVYARQEEALWRALLLRLIEALRNALSSPAGLVDPNDVKLAEHDLDEAQASLYRSMTLKEQGGVRFNWVGALPLAADVALSAVTAGISTEVAKAMSGDEHSSGLTSALTKWFNGDDTQKAIKLIERKQSERYVDQVVSLEQFQDRFRTLLKRFGVGSQRKLYIFIDDLDRCLPEEAVAALEAVKLFLNMEGCIFILGMDREVVEQGIRARYKELGPTPSFDPREYLDKIVQIPFSLPPLGADQISNYLTLLSRQDGQQGAIACNDLIRAAAPANPRTLKRVLNILTLSLYLDGMSDADIASIAKDKSDRVRYICKIVLLQTVFPTAYRHLAQSPLLLRDVENFAERRQNKLRDEEKVLVDLPRLQNLLNLPPVFDTLADDEIVRLFTLSKITAPASP
jgi:hypothetical protein